MNDESSKYRAAFEAQGAHAAVEGTIVNTRSNSVGGFHLEVEADMGFFVGQRVWFSRQAPASQPNAAADAQADVTCPKCGATSSDEAATRCVPDRWGDSCPGCEDPIAAAWDAHPAPSQAVGAVDAKPEQDDGLTAAYMLGRYDSRKEKPGQASGEIVGYFCEDTGDFMSLKSYTWQVENVRPLDGYVAVIRRCREPKPEQAVGGGEATVRYCPECSHLGEVHSDFRDCCPDGSKARYIPTHIAEAAQRDFRASIAPRPAVATAGDGVTEDAAARVLRKITERVEHYGRVGRTGDKYTDGRRHEARLILDLCNAALASPSAPRVGVPDGWTSALDAAVAAIYFADSSDYETALWQVVKHLKPDLVDLLQSDESAAYEQVKAMLVAAPEVPNG